jgi:hypothetical protein
VNFSPHRKFDFLPCASKNLIYLFLLHKMVLRHCCHLIFYMHKQFHIFPNFIFCGAFNFSILYFSHRKSIENIHIQYMMFIINCFSIQIALCMLALPSIRSHWLFCSFVRDICVHGEISLSLSCIFY